MNKKLIASAIAALGLAASGSASAIIVGGVDFGAGGTHIETTTLAETLPRANGDTVYGYGQVNTVNGNLFYAGANRLYFAFDQYTVNDFNPLVSADLSGGRVRLYLMPTFNLLAQSSEANWTSITTTSPLWLELAGHNLQSDGSATQPDTLRATGTFTGVGFAFTGAGLLDVVGGLSDVVSFLNSNSINDAHGGFADIALTSSGSNLVLNPNDNTTACATGGSATRANNWCIAGTADLRGTTVPEPGVLALVGLGLLGMGVSLRKRKSA